LIRLEALPCLAKALADGGVDGVALLRPVDGDDVMPSLVS